MDVLNPQNVCLILLVGGISLLVLWSVFKVLKIWLMAFITESGITMFDIIGMRLRKVDPMPVLMCKILLQKSGCSEVTNTDLESHVIAGGNLDQVSRAMVKAKRAGLELDWNSACLMDRKGIDFVDHVAALAAQGHLESRLLP
jgi:uncharacterized protein YqfA (UPF0365 family)